LVLRPRRDALDAEGPIAVNVFARFYDADAFFAVCRRMRLEGAKRLEIARAQR